MVRACVPGELKQHGRPRHLWSVSFYIWLGFCCPFLKFNPLWANTFVKCSIYFHIFVDRTEHSNMLLGNLNSWTWVTWIHEPGHGIMQHLSVSFWSSGVTSVFNFFSALPLCGQYTSWTSCPFLIHSLKFILEKSGLDLTSRLELQKSISSLWGTPEVSSSVKKGDLFRPQF